MAVKDFSEAVHIEMPSKLLLLQLLEVSKKAKEVADEYLTKVEQRLVTVENAVSLLVSMQLGIKLSPDLTLSQLMLEQAVECSKKAARLELIAKNLEILPEHVIRLSIDQAKDFGL